MIDTNRSTLRWILDFPLEQKWFTCQKNAAFSQYWKVWIRVLIRQWRFRSKQDLLQFPNNQRKTFARQTVKKPCLDLFLSKLFRHKESLAVNNIREDFLSDQYIYNEMFSTILSIFLRHFLFHRFSDKSVLCIGNEYRTVQIDNVLYNNSIKFTHLYQIFLGNNTNDITLHDISVNTLARFTYVIFVDRDLVHWATGFNPGRREKHRIGIIF